MTVELTYVPIQTSYASEELPGTILLPLAGGPARKRKDLLLSGHVVNAQWFLESEDYTRFMGFFVSDLRYGKDDFLLDLVTDIGIPTTHKCRTVGGLPKLIQQQGYGYWVSCQLECDKNPTFTNTITYSIGSGPSWVFDGIDDRVTMGDVLDKQNNQAFSISVFASQDAIAGHLIAKCDTPNRRGWRLFINGLGKLDFRLSNNDLSPFNRIVVSSNSSGYADGVERQYGVTYDGSLTAAGVTLYVNGVPVASTPDGFGDTLSGTTLNSSSLNIGGIDDTNSVGGGSTSIKHVSIWDRELTPSEMSQVGGSLTYPNLNALSFASNLEAWWKLDGTDTTAAGGVTDHSSNTFNGTAVNGLGSGGPSQGQIVFSNIAASFQAGDLIRIIDSAGIHPDGNVPLNLDGIYTIEDTIGLNALLLENPTSINSDWTTLFNIDPSAEYGNLANGNVNSTITKVPT